MAVFYREGEKKTRPDIYQRHSNIGFSILTVARDGICAIPVQAKWGPLGKVVKNTLKTQLEKNYGTGTYGAGYTVPAAAAMFDGGAATVYTYRMGTGGAKATLSLTGGMVVTAKYVGSLPISVAVKNKIGDSAMKQFQVYTGNSLVESFDFAADGANEGANLIAEVAESRYVDITAATPPATVEILAVASGALTGGSDPVVTNEDYSKAFGAFETTYYNCIALDVDDDKDMTLSLLLQEYRNNSYTLGKLGIAVVGEKTTVDFEKRLEHSRAFNDCKVVCLGGGWMSGTVNKDGVMAICQTAGVIASTPANKGIVHAEVYGATDLCESLTYSQYEDAIRAGMLMVSMSPDGTIWYDSGVNTLITPDEQTQDEGWKKIRRVKTRFEMIDRLDRELMPKVGRVSCDSDGIADVVQAGQRILDAMVNEGKLFSGATFKEDPEHPAEGDSAWFIIQADDIDSLEMIYLHYQFRYSQKV